MLPYPAPSPGPATCIIRCPEWGIGRKSIHLNRFCQRFPDIGKAGPPTGDLK